MPDRVRRYADWLRALDPAGYAARADVLSDVEPLARWLERKDREVRRARARRELQRTARDAARSQDKQARLVGEGGDDGGDEMAYD